MRKTLATAVVLAAGAVGVLQGCVSSTAVETRVPDQIAKSDPVLRARIHTDRAAEYYLQGNMAVALEAAKQAVAASPTHAPAHDMLGIIYMQLADDAQAAQSFEQALRLTPNDSGTLNNYGWFVCQRQNPANAIQYFQAALKNPLYATPESALYNAGMCLKKANDIRGAEVQFRAAVLRQPLFAAGLYELAEIEFARGNVREAEALIARHNRLVQQPNADVLLLGARIARMLGDKSAESSYVQQLRRRYPDAPQTRAASNIN